jgi:cytochrome c5
MSDEDKNTPDNIDNDSKCSSRHYEGISDEDIVNFHNTQAEEARTKADFGFQTMPIAIIFLFGGIIFWAAVYLAKNTAEFREDIFHPSDLYGDVVVEDEGFNEEKFLKKGQKIYEQRCAQCHQGNGKGLPPAFPPLAKSEWVVGNPAIPAKIIMMGLNGPIDVLGTTYNGAMPALGEMLKDKDIAAVVSYIRKSWGNDASIVMEEDVTKYRAAIGDRTTAWTISEVVEASK